MGDYVKKGYKGVKTLFVPELDGSISIEGWESSLGRNARGSEQVTADFMGERDRFGPPVLLRPDLRRYGEFTEEMLSAHPDPRINIPFFGGSQKKMAQLLSTYANRYTDFSSLLPDMKKDPKVYRDCISSFPERILFGSDALFGLPSMRSHRTN